MDAGLHTWDASSSMYVIADRQSHLLQPSWHVADRARSQLGANLSLALQNSYSALVVLRCLQSSGSSGTAVLAQAVTSDIATRAERGKYFAYAIIGLTFGPALGPV